MEENKLQYTRAKKRIRNKIDFLYFSIAYLVVSAVLLFVNFDDFKSGFGNLHRNILIITQGIILAVYGFYLFFPYSKKWEEKKIKHLMEKYKKESA